MLHRPNHSDDSRSSPPNSNQPNSALPTIHHINRVDSIYGRSINPTATVTVWGGRLATTTRALLDNGADVSLISERLVHELQLKRRRKLAVLDGIGGHLDTRHVVNVSIAALTADSQLIKPSKCCEVTCHVVDDVSCYSVIPDYRNPDLLKLMKGKEQWADPEKFSHKRIELILGTQILSDMRLPGSDVVKSTTTSLVADRYIFGWAVHGGMPAGPSSESIIVNKLTRNSDASLDRLLTKFWEIEDFAEPTAKMCYLSTYSRLPSGQYQVELPKRDPSPLLGSKAFSVE